MSRTAFASLASLLSIVALTAGCGGGSAASGPTITVTGVVRSGPGLPVNGAKVFLNDDAGRVVTTGADGTFSFTGVTTPYALGVAAGFAVRSYHGLTAPTVLLSTSNVMYEGTISGQVTGVSFPLPAGEQIVVAGSGLSFQVGASPDDGTFHGTVHWSAGAGPTTTTLVALHYRPDTGGSSKVEAYLSSGQRTGVALTHGANLTGQDVALGTPVPTVESVLAVALGGYANPFTTLATIQVGPATITNPAAASVGLTSGDHVLVPAAGGAVQANASLFDGTAMLVVPVVGAGTTGVVYPLAPPLTQTAPDLGATVSTTSPTLAWSPVAGATLYVVTISGSSSFQQFYLPGSQASLVVPGLAAVGGGLARGESYNWSVVAYVAPWLSPAFHVDPATDQYDPAQNGRALGFYGTGGRGFAVAP